MRARFRVARLLGRQLPDIAGGLYAIAFAVVIAALVAMALGAGLVDLSKLAGAPLPTVHDDPDRVEVLGLVLLAGYGLLAGGAVAALCWLARVLPAGARRWLGRGGGAAALVGLAVASGYVVVVGDDLQSQVFAAGVAVSAAAGAVRVARGRALFDDDESNGQPEPSRLPLDRPEED